MNKVVLALANLKKLENGNSVKAVHDVYPKSQPALKKPIPKIDKIFIWKLFKKHQPPGFIWNDANEKIIYTILLYFLKNQNFNRYGIIQNEASLNKGLLVYGDFGVGKTALFTIIRAIGRDLCKFNYYNFWFSQISAGSFVENYMTSTNRGDSTFKLENFYKGKLYIDDLGYEKKAFNRDEILGDILFERNRNACKTFVTTNLKPFDLSEKYGQRIGDRLPEMFNIISWRGESFRK